MRQRDDSLARAQRTWTGRIWTALIPALVFLVLLIVFIAENGQHVEVKFFGATGHISLALALLIAAVAGAVVVLLVGTVRILQLRLAAWRHQRQVDRPPPAAGSAPATSGPVPSAPVAPAHEPQAVEPQRDPDDTRP
ncbi:MAG TPA: lipopolysaccharide assembly protein LapA domain-containing protein [Mycobacteriales bacterium]|nr:lipopolysaccharide assembly protein LapA domain-containing protein [Mycobacteriales bacterium]